jgi:hypothetical protein
MQTTPAGFSLILAKGSAHIKAAGGDVTQIKAFNNGEAMLYYVRASELERTAVLARGDTVEKPG